MGPLGEYLEARRKQIDGGRSWAGAPSWTTYLYRFQDGGRSWGDRRLLQEWGTETHVFQLSFGRLLAAIRYQRAGASPALANERYYLAAADCRTDIPNPPEIRSVRGNQSTVGKRVFQRQKEDRD